MFFPAMSASNCMHCMHMYILDIEGGLETICSAAYKYMFIFIAQLIRPTLVGAGHIGYGPFLLKLLVTVKIMCKKKVFQMCNKCCQGCSGEH